MSTAGQIACEASFDGTAGLRVWQVPLQFDGCDVCGYECEVRLSTCPCCASQRNVDATLTKVQNDGEVLYIHRSEKTNANEDQETKIKGTASSTFDNLDPNSEDGQRILQKIILVLLKYKPNFTVSLDTLRIHLRRKDIPMTRLQLLKFASKSVLQLVVHKDLIGLSERSLKILSARS